MVLEFLNGGILGGYDRQETDCKVKVKVTLPFWPLRQYNYQSQSYSNGTYLPSTFIGTTTQLSFFYVPDHCNSFEDWVPVDFICGNPIFKSVAVT